MHKRAFILTVIGLALISMLAAAPGLTQPVQQPKATAPQAEKAAVPDSQGEQAPEPAPAPAPAPPDPAHNG